MKRVQRSEGKCKLSKERVKACNDYVIGRETPYRHTTDGRDLGSCRFHFHCVTYKIVFTTPKKATVFSLFAILREFLTDICD